MATGMRLVPAPVISMESWAWAREDARASAQAVAVPRRKVRMR
jgi:hypothetical protein